MPGRIPAMAGGRSAVRTPFNLGGTVVTILRLEVLVVVAVFFIAVFPVMDVPVVMNPVDGISPDLVGDGVVTHGHPRAVVIRGRIPDIAVIQVVAVAQVKHVVADSRGDIETQPGRKEEQRRPFDDHGRIDVYRRRTADIDAYADADVRGVCQRCDSEDNRATEKNFSHTGTPFN